MAPALRPIRALNGRAADAMASAPPFKKLRRSRVQCGLISSAGPAFTNSRIGSLRSFIWLCLFIAIFPEVKGYLILALCLATRPPVLLKIVGTNDLAVTFA